MHQQVVDDTKLGGAVDTPDGHVTIHTDLNRSKKRPDKNIINFNNHKHQLLNLSRNNAMHQYRLDAIWLEDSFADKILGSILLCQQSNAEPGCPVRLWSVHLWRYSNPNAHSWELSARADPCFEQGLFSRSSPELYSNLSHSLFLCCKEYWSALS